MSSDFAPRISVVIPAYNTADFVDMAIESALDQTYPACEVIVVDDGSADGTFKMVQQDYPEVRVFRQQNGGPGAARNHGVRQALGEWVALLDADDAWLPHKLERQLPYMAKTGVGVVHATTAGADEVPDTITFDMLWHRNRICNSSVVVRRTVWDSVGGCDEDRSIISVEDYNLWLRIAAAGWEITTCRENLIRYLPAPGNLTSSFARFAQAELVNVERIGTQLPLDAPTLYAKRVPMRGDNTHPQTTMPKYNIQIRKVSI